MASSPRSSGVVIIGAITAVGTQLITTFLRRQHRPLGRRQPRASSKARRSSITASTDQQRPSPAKATGSSGNFPFGRCSFFSQPGEAEPFLRDPEHNHPEFIVIRLEREPHDGRCIGSMFTGVHSAAKRLNDSRGSSGTGPSTSLVQRRLNFYVKVKGAFAAERF